MLMRLEANWSSPKENGHLNRALRNSFIKDRNKKNDLLMFQEPSRDVKASMLHRH